MAHMSFCWFCRAAAQIAKYVAGIDAHKLNASVKFTPAVLRMLISFLST